MHQVYILYSKSIDKFYIGETSNILQRIAYHNDPVKNQIWTRKGIPWEFKIAFEVGTEKAGKNLERQLKKAKSKSVLIRIIEKRQLPERWGLDFQPRSLSENFFFGNFHNNLLAIVLKIY